MPAAQNASPQAIVSMKYMLQIHLAVVESLGCIFAFMGPVASAANTLTLPPTSDGRMAMVKNTIPNPPIHWVSDRQKSMACGNTSTSSMIDAPVVVKPDVDSKKASVTFVMLPCIRNGNIPKNENTTHAAVTTTYASLRLRLLSASRPRYRKKKPLPKVISSDIRKAIRSSSPNEKAIRAHNDMNNASMNSSEPIILLMIRKFTISYFS